MLMYAAYAKRGTQQVSNYTAHKANDQGRHLSTMKGKCTSFANNI